MKKTSLKIVSAAVLAALSIVSGQASAVTFESAGGHVDNVVTSYATGSLLSFDIEFKNQSPVMLAFRIEAATSPPAAYTHR